MSFSIEIGKISSPTNSIKKNFTSKQTISGTLRNESEILNPTIIIQSSSALENLFKCNYMKIADFGRCYFITSVKCIRTFVYEVQAHCDVLSSFASEILTNEAIVLRQENNFNLLLNDDVFKCKQNSRVYYKKFPSGLGNYNYILTVAGGH